MDRVLLNGMHHTSDANHCSGDRPRCLGGTRGDVFVQLKQWLKDGRDQRVFWLNGLAGTGKSTIAQTFAEIMFADGNLGASFFCSRDFDNRSDLRAIFPTLAFQLAYQYPRFREELLKLLRTKPDIGRESLHSQMEKLIVGPFKATQIRTLIIIDALDECKDENPESAILFILSKHVDRIPNVKFFITGRPETQIRSGFRLPSLQPITREFKLHEVECSLVNNDIRLFFRTQLANIPQNRSDCDFTEDWPNPSDIDILCEKAAGFFIYASTVLKFVTSKNHSPARQLKQIISLPHSTACEGRSGIDLLYTQVLEQAVGDVDADDKELHSHFKIVVGAVSLVFNPLSVKALSDLLRVPDTSTALRSLHSLLLVPTNKDAPIRIFHKSFPDFLTDPGRCKDPRFFVDQLIHHQEIVFSCLSVMKDRLKKNICSLDDFALLSKVKDLPTRRKAYIGDALEYACCFWTNHLVRISGSGPEAKGVKNAINEFFTIYLPFWIEALSLMGNLDVGVYALNNIQQWYTLVSCVEHLQRKHLLRLIQTGTSCKWADDTQRFLLEHFEIIHDSPSQIYHFALPFCPSSSWLHKCYAAELSQEVKVVKGLQAKWGACSRTVPFLYTPQALASWKDLIAVGLESYNSNIIILDAITGVCISVFSKHTDWVRSLAFSLDGIFLVSGSNDETVNLWDVQTGGVIKTFHGHTNHVLSVSISLDRSTVASGSRDRTVRLWDIQTGECRHIIEQQCGVRCVRFSPTDPQHLMFVPGDKVWQWDINGHQLEPVYDGSYFAFSLDGNQFVSCKGTTVTVQNSDSGTVVAKFCVANRDFSCCCFSSDGRLVAGAADSAIYIWDITSSNPHLIETFVGHTNLISTLAFPSSLISVSRDRSIKFWQIGVSSTNPTVADTTSTPPTSASIESVTLQVRDGIVISSDSAGVVKIWDISTGLHKASFQTPAKGYTYRDVQLIQGKLVLVWRKDLKTHIWDAEKDEFQIVATPEFSANGLRISGDGSKIFIPSKNFIQAWSMQTGETMGKVELKGDPYLDPLYVDGSRIWVCFEDTPTQGWDFGNPGSPPIPLSGTSLNGRPHLKFIHGTKWENGPARVEDAVTGKEVFRLRGRYAKPTEVQWDGRYLVAGYKSGEMLILDFKHMLPK